ncbi:MAG: DUF1611 domain-containing protein [Gemmatimonadales bacterium]|nr:DUF1611 domain-containing protein [Gemmatimonadales bacterium]
MGVEPSQHRFLILADGQFGPLSSKTANSCIRYFPERIVAVLDREHAGKSVQDVLGFGGPIPVVGDFARGIAEGHGATAVLIGIAPMGGRLPDEWRAWLRSALERGLEIWSGLHTFIGDDPELGPLARAKGVRILDARRPPPDLPIADGRAAEVEAFVILTVGSDCNVGKMTAQLELRDELVRRGHRTSFVATGQTGIFIEGWGTAVDAVAADFIAGAAEQLVLQGARGNDIVLVEGQGSLLHPGYSGVTLGLMHGACPDALILCHQSTRDFIGDYHGREPWVRIPPLPELIDIYERAARPVHPTKVIGICLNTFDMDEAAAREAVARAEEETGLPATDPVRFAATPLVDAIIREAAMI